MGGPAHRAPAQSGTQSVGLAAGCSHELQRRVRKCRQLRLLLPPFGLSPEPLCAMQPWVRGAQPAGDSIMVGPICVP